MACGVDRISLSMISAGNSNRIAASTIQKTLTEVEYVQCMKFLPPRRTQSQSEGAHPKRVPTPRPSTGSMPRENRARSPATRRWLREQVCQDADLQSNHWSEYDFHAYAAVSTAQCIFTHACAQPFRQRRRPLCAACKRAHMYPAGAPP